MAFVMINCDRCAKKSHITQHKDINSHKWCRNPIYELFLLYLTNALIEEDRWFCEEMCLKLREFPCKTSWLVLCFAVDICVFTRYWIDFDFP